MVTFDPLINKRVEHHSERRMPEERIHLAEDRVFFYLRRVYPSYGGENAKIALAFQREVINNIVPQCEAGSHPLQ